VVKMIKKSTMSNKQKAKTMDEVRVWMHSCAPYAAGKVLR